jgi:hypothetical protein
MSTENLPAVVTTATEMSTGGYFETVGMFEAGQRMAKLFASADFVPDTFKGKVADCLIALDMAARLKANPIAVMQNIYMVHNKPAWSSQFLIASINKSGLFKTPLRYRFSGKEGTEEYGCVAWAVDNSGEILESTKITIGMATKEGWTTKNGSKWKTMPEQMLRYRAATFFARAYCPELTMGMMTNDEVRDTYDVEYEVKPNGKSATAAKLDKALGLDKPAESADPQTTKEKDWEKNLPPFPETTEREPGEEG